MLIRPTSVAAVICQALSPELSQLAYGENKSDLLGPCGNSPPWAGRIRPSGAVSMCPIGWFHGRFPFVTRLRRERARFRPCVSRTFSGLVAELCHISVTVSLRTLEWLPAEDLRSWHPAR